MIKYLLIAIFLLINSLSAGFLPGDSVPDFKYQELNFNSNASVDTLNRSLHSILSDGRTVIIYFFSITYS